MLGMVESPNNQGWGEGSETQKHSQLHHGFEASLGYMRIT